MTSICINGHRIKTAWYDALINAICCLWDGNGNVRRVPRNIFDIIIIKSSFGVALIFLPVAWLLSHVPFIWPEYLAGMALLSCVFLGMKPYLDCFRALVVLIICSFLLYYQVTFDATVWGFHVEPYLYDVVIIGALITLWRRFCNWVCWLQIDRICEKYGIPQYDQKALMDAYEGFDTHYGEERVIYSNYQEAVHTAEQTQQKQDNQNA